MPSAADDRPAWGKVAILAVVGFAIGIAWPRLAGVRLGPSAPSESIPAAARPGAAGDPSAASLAQSADEGPADAGAGTGAAGAANGPLVTVQRGAILSCRTASGELQKGREACGDLAALDAIVTPRLRKLAACPAAAGQTGKLSVVVGVDFPANRLTVGIGHSSTVPNHEALAACLHGQLDAVSLGAINHEQPRYTVQYTTTLAAGAGAGGSGGSATTNTVSIASGTAPSPVGATPAAASSDEASGPGAQVVWDVAIVRDTPRTGSVVARLSRGTKLHVASGQDGWYRVRYGSGFASEGWVYRAAIGK